MKYAFQNKLFKLTLILESIIGIYILIATIESGVGMTFALDFKTLFLHPDYIKQALNTASLIIIGIEFVKMICSHTIDAVIEVILLALARQMILYHPSALDNLLTVISISLLFVIRKYMYISQLDRIPRENASGFHVLSGLFKSKKTSEENNNHNVETEVVS